MTKTTTTKTTTPKILSMTKAAIYARERRAKLKAEATAVVLDELDLALEPLVEEVPVPPPAPPTAPAMTIAERTTFLVGYVKAHAAANYEREGWDYVVETMSDDDIANLVRKCRSRRGAKQVVRRVITLWNDRRADIAATAF